MMRFLFVDRILELVPGIVVRGIKHITHNDAYLCQDEFGRLNFMPSLIGETLGQLAAWNVMYSNQFTQRPVAGVVSSARLHRPALVGETLLLESHIEALDDTAVQYHSIAKVGDETVFTVDGALGPLLPMNDFIDSHSIRQQFNEINRPGDWLTEQVRIPNTPSNDLHFNLPPFIDMHFDAILSCDPGESIVAEKRITRAAPWFPDHFPNKPVLPMTVLLECKQNLAREFLARSNWSHQYQIHELRKIKMNVFVYPGDVVTTYVKVKSRDEHQLVLNFRSEVDGQRVCVLDIILTAKGDA